MRNQPRHPLVVFCFLLMIPGFPLWAQRQSGGFGERSLLEAAARFSAMPTQTVDLIPFVGRAPTFASSSPFNDVEYTLFDTDYIEGETAGYDTFCPVDPSDAWPGQDRVVLIHCTSNVDTDQAYGGTLGDRIILGTAEIEHPFFLAGENGVDDDWVVIVHFNYIHGCIQLRGQPEDYGLVYGSPALGCASKGWYLFYTRSKHPDLIAFITPCSEVQSRRGNPGPSGTSPLCNEDGLLSLTNPDQFVYARPIATEPTLPGFPQYGGLGKDVVGGGTADARGNVYIVGSSDSNLDGDSTADNEMFVMKVDAQGQRQWVTEIGTTDGALLFDAATDGTHLYAAGRTLGRLPGFENQGKWDGVLIKLDCDTGDILAMDQWGTPGLDGYGNVTLDDAGNLFVSGAGSPPQGPFQGDYAYLVAKYRVDTLENVWRTLDPVLPNADKVAEAWGGLTYVPGEVPGDGKLIVGGWFRPTGAAPTGADGFVTLYGDLNQAAPSILAVQTISSPGFKADWILDNTADSEGNIYAVGYTTGSLEASQRGQGDAFIVKYRPNLSDPVYKQIGTAKSDQFRKLEIDAQDRLYAVGYTYGDYETPGYQGVNRDPSLATGDILVQAFDTRLNPLGALQFGTGLEDRAFAALVDTTLYAIGITEASLTGPSLGSFDAFIVPVDTLLLTTPLAQDVLENERK